MKKRKQGEGTSTILSQFDIDILNTLNSSKKEFAILELQEYLNCSHMSLKRHLWWLDDLHMVSLDRVPKSRKTIPHITKEGKTVLDLFLRLIKNKKESKR